MVKQDRKSEPGFVTLHSFRQTGNNLLFGIWKKNGKNVGLDFQIKKQNNRGQENLYKEQTN